MNKFTLALGLMLASVFFFNSSRYSQSNSGGAPAARTGAPLAAGGNEMTCTNCHNGSLNSGPNSVDIAFDGDPQSLVAGEIYNVTVSITGSSATEAGFQIVCLNPAKATCGTWTAATGSKKVTGSLRTYMTHTNKNNTSWSFTWTAPASTPDSVFFYASARENAGGSKTYTAKKKFINNVTDVNAQITMSSFELYPTVTSGSIYLKMNAMLSPFGQVNILDHMGRLVLQKTISAEEVNAQEALVLDLPADAQSGLYFCQAIVSGKPVVKCFFKN